MAHGKRDVVECYDGVDLHMRRHHNHKRCQEQVSRAIQLATSGNAGSEPHTYYYCLVGQNMNL